MFLHSPIKLIVKPETLDKPRALEKDKTNKLYVKLAELGNVHISL